MKTQRHTFQTNKQKQDETPETDLNKMEISDLLDKNVQSNCCKDAGVREQCMKKVRISTNRKYKRGRNEVTELKNTIT